MNGQKLFLLQKPSQNELHIKFYRENESLYSNTTLHLPVYAASHPACDQYPIIVHGPDEINSFHESRFIIGVVCALHGNNNSDLKYIWYHDGEQYDGGENLSITEVSVEGLYSAVVQVDVAGKVYQYASNSLQVFTHIVQATEENLGLGSSNKVISLTDEIKQVTSSEFTDTELTSHGPALRLCNEEKVTGVRDYGTELGSCNKVKATNHGARLSSIHKGKATEVLNNGSGSRSSNKDKATEGTDQGTRLRSCKEVTVTKVANRGPGLSSIHKGKATEVPNHGSGSGSCNEGKATEVTNYGPALGSCDEDKSV